MDGDLLLEIKYFLLCLSSVAKPREEAPSKQGMSKMKITHVSIITNCKMSVIFSLIYFMFWLIFLKVKKQKCFHRFEKKIKK